MSSFGEVERGFEAAGAEDLTREVRAQARRNRMIGEWAAKLMGLENTEDYAQAISPSEVTQRSDFEVARKVHQDLTGAGLHVTSGEINARMDEFLAIARERVHAGS